MYESIHNKKGINFYLTSYRYISTINDVKELKCVKETQTVHYVRSKRYDILNIRREEKLKVPLQKKQKFCTMLLLIKYSTLYTMLIWVRN